MIDFSLNPKGTTTQIREAALGQNGCQGLVTRNFEEDACYKDVTCLVFHYDADTFSTHISGACAYHANRYGGKNVIPLEDIIAALQQEENSK